MGIFASCYNCISSFFCGKPENEKLDEHNNDYNIIMSEDNYMNLENISCPEQN
jgi:hypothetical protein